EQFQLGFERSLDRTHVGNGRSVAEAFDPIGRRNTDNVTLADRAGAQRKAPVRILLPHRARLDVEVSNDHQAPLLSGLFDPRMTPGAIRRRHLLRDLRACSDQVESASHKLAGAMRVLASRTLTSNWHSVST